MRKGEMATWPYVRELHVRMDIEVELHSEYFPKQYTVLRCTCC